MRTARVIRIMLALALPGGALAIPSGCGAAPVRDAERASSPAAISHVVLVALKPADRQPGVVAAIWSDAQAMLATIPGVASFAAGPHVETGRASVTGGYDLGLYIGFEDRAGYAAYVEHPQHVKFVERWRPRLESLIVYDFADTID